MILPSAVPLALAAVVFALLLGLERARPLRPPSQSKARRAAIAAGFAASSALVMVLGYPALVMPALDLCARNGVGLLRWARVPAPFRAAIAFVLLDYSLWLWHRLNHRVPFLWRFHAAHHADLDLDVLTAWRFHFGEIAASIPFRTAQVVLLGVDLGPLLGWEVTILVAAQFHHANLRMPTALERMLRLLVVTPRLHGIHHAIEPRDVSSNFGTLFSVWDQLHGVHRWRVDAPPAIGLPELRDPRALTLLRSLALPFKRHPPRRPEAPS